MSVVYVNESPVVQAGEDWISRLVRAAAAAPLRRARLCLHRDEEDSVQEMVIALMRDTAVAPHRHPGRSESFHVIRGELTVVLFDDDGRVTEEIRLGEPGSKRPFLYRLCEPRWHTVVVESDVAVVHEVIAGPFDDGSHEEAAWGAATVDRSRP